MHESEISAAEQILGSSGRTDAFVVGEASDAQIAELRSKGLIVQEITAGRPETPGRGSSAFGGGLRSTTFSTVVARAPIDDLPDLSKPNVYLIGFHGPLLEAHRAQLKAIGVELLQAYKGDFYSAYLTMPQRTEVSALPFVSGVEFYGALHKSAARLSPEAAGAASPKDERLVIYDVKLQRPEDAASLKDWLQKNDLVIVAASARKIRIALLANSAVLGQLAGRTEVERIEEYVEPQLFNDHARILLRIDHVPAQPFPYDGTGELVAVADTGLDDTHPDFAGRFTTAALGRSGRTDDPNGHGTHVAGSVLGDGAGSNGAFKGTAPAAKLFFQSLLDSTGGLGGLPADLGDLFDQAYKQGARIHSNSWGSSTPSTYTMSSGEVDDFVAAHQDMLVVIAAGNEGQAATNMNSPAGFVDWLSIGAPATAKNALAVGASRSDRTTGGMSTTTWATAWPARFPSGPIAAATISGDPEALAGFSSRGPSDDRRIKPDVVAPGTDILSVKSKLAPITNFWGPHTNSLYAYDGGTSMATPLVSGCAALVREYFSKERAYQKPSAALVRSCLINGARWLTAADSIASNPPGVTPVGNFDQGFGCVDMSSTLPNPANPKLKLEFVDSWVSSPSVALRMTGDNYRYVVSVDSGLPLRICLAYTDVPGRALQNNLNLLVQTPSNAKLTGNFQLRMGLLPLDTDNNVEVVRIEAPAKGDYLIQVTAANLLKPPQEFALVVSGDLTSKLAPF
jgi:hypothetical protein